MVFFYDHRPRCNRLCFYFIPDPTNLVVNGDIVTASAGTPELVSDSSISLTATDRVEITQSPLKMASFTTTERNLLSAENGDIIYNTTDNKFQGYENGSWANLI